METYTIDATDKKLGRVATEAADALRGKNRADFTPHAMPEVAVHITNAAKLDLPPEKRERETFESYSGYPGGRTVRTMNEVIATHGYGEVVRRAVHGMLPDNRLRARFMKRLQVTE